MRHVIDSLNTAVYDREKARKLKNRSDSNRIRHAIAVKYAIEGGELGHYLRSTIHKLQIEGKRIFRSRDVHFGVPEDFPQSVVSNTELQCEKGCLFR
jgi:hypothetical protein